MEPNLFLIFYYVLDKNKMFEFYFCRKTKPNKHEIYVRQKTFERVKEKIVIFDFVNKWDIYK